MRHTDVAIVGGGLAGATTAAMLGQAGIAVALIDPRAIAAPDFRCEKLDRSQIALLRKTGLAEAVSRVAESYDAVLIARPGFRVASKRVEQLGIRYHTLVNAVRGEIPADVEMIACKAQSVSTSADRQEIVLANGEAISARLLVLANGLNIGLRHLLGVERAIVSACHSISIGFDLEPLDQQRFGFRGLTCYPRCSADKIAYLTLFPVGAAMRANLFVYRDPRDPWLRSMRRSPRDTLLAAFPDLAALAGEFAVAGEVTIRPVDLTVTRGHRQPGVVLIGDAFATSCPAAGTGVNKVLTDTERLCHLHVPQWLATPGMSEAKIASFYDDPVKQACDADSAAKAQRLRSLSVDTGPLWRARRWGRFAGRLGAEYLGKVGARLPTLLPGGHGQLAARRRESVSMVKFTAATRGPE